MARKKTLQYLISYRYQLEGEKGFGMCILTRDKLIMSEDIPEIEKVIKDSDSDFLDAKILIMNIQRFPL